MSNREGSSLNILEMCENIMPECWNDDMRMGALFSPFRKRNVNPLDWESKQKFWENLIEKWCVLNKRSKVNLQLLKRAFQRKGTAPLCLETVIEEMLRKGTLVPYSNFVKLVPQESWSAWVVTLLVKRPAVWTFNKLKESLVSSTFGDHLEYVHITAVKLQAEELLSALPERDRNKVLDMAELRLATGSKLEMDEELAIVVHWLRRENQAAVCRPVDGGPLLIKVAGTQAKRVSLTELDVGLYSLRCSEKTLTRHVEQLEEQQEAVLDQAREYIGRNMKQMAKSCLRKRRQLGQCVEKRISALENVRLLINRLQDTESDAEVLEAYRTGVSALKLALGEAGLTEDTAANTVLQVQEVLDVHEEINAALSQPVRSSVDEDLEQELACLLKDTASSPPGAPSAGSGSTSPQKNSAKTLLTMPEVPSHEPTAPPVWQQLPA